MNGDSLDSTKTQEQQILVKYKHHPKSPSKKDGKSISWVDQADKEDVENNNVHTSKDSLDHNKKHKLD